MSEQPERRPCGQHGAGMTEQEFKNKLGRYKALYEERNKGVASTGMSAREFHEKIWTGTLEEDIHLVDVYRFAEDFAADLRSQLAAKEAEINFVLASLGIDSDESGYVVENADDDIEVDTFKEAIGTAVRLGNERAEKAEAELAKWKSRWERTEEMLSSEGQGS